MIIFMSNNMQYCYTWNQAWNKVSSVTEYDMEMKTEKHAKEKPNSG